MSMGYKMFKSNNTREIFNHVMAMDIHFPAHLDPDIKDLISKLVVHDPLNRLGFKNFQKLKGHKFFDGINWKNL